VNVFGVEFGAHRVDGRDLKVTITRNGLDTRSFLNGVKGVLTGERSATETLVNCLPSFSRTTCTVESKTPGGQQALPEVERMMINDIVVNSVASDASAGARSLLSDAGSSSS